MNNWYITLQSSLFSLKWWIACCSNHKSVKLLHLSKLFLFILCSRSKMEKIFRKFLNSRNSSALHTNWHLNIYSNLTWEKRKQSKKFLDDVLIVKDTISMCIKIWYLIFYYNSLISGKQNEEGFNFNWILI